MPITVVWDDDRQMVIRTDCAPAWTWQEWQQATLVMHTLLDAVDHPVSVLVDARDTVLPCDTMKQLPTLRHTARQLVGHPIRLIVVVGSADYLDVLASIYEQVYGGIVQAVVRAVSLPEAYALLASCQPNRN